MGSEISSLVLEPLLGIGAVVLGIYAIIEEKKGKDTNAEWFAIGSIVVVILLIILNIVLSMLG